MENSPYVFLGVLGFYFSIAFIISSIMRNKPEQNLPDERVEPELADSFYVGGYLGGLTTQAVDAPFVRCKITRDHFVFCRGLQGAEVGRVPRSAVNKVTVTPLSRLPQILPAEFQAVKKRKVKTGAYCLILRWQDSRGARHNAAFQFSDGKSEAAATEAADTLSFWSKENFFTRYAEEGCTTKMTACENT